MNRRNFLIKSGAFIAATIVLPIELPAKLNSNSFIFPKTTFDLNDRWKFVWHGFRPCSDSFKLVGRWTAHPMYKGIYDRTRFSIFSNVVIYAEDLNIENLLFINDIEYPPFVKQEIQYGLDMVLEMIENGERIAEKHGIKGAVPIDYCLKIDKKLLSNMRRTHTKMGIWPGTKADESLVLFEVVQK